MISITLKGLAKFMMATPAKQRKILRDYKYPREEGQAMAQYYKEARDVVYSFHKNKRAKEWLMAKGERDPHLGFRPGWRQWPPAAE